MKLHSDIGRFIRSSGIFFAGNILSKAMSLLLLPFYTRLIPVEDMGYFDVSITYVNMAISILFFEIWSAILRFMYDGKELSDKYGAVKSGGVIFGVSAAVYLLGILALGWVMDIRYLNLISGYGLCQCAVSLWSFAARGLGHNVDFALSGILNVLCTAAVNILLILRFRVDFSAMYYGYICGSMVQIVYLELRTKVLYRSFACKTDWQQVRNMFRYAIPLCMNTVAYWLLTGFNRLAVNWSLGNEANGLLAIGNRFGMMVTILTTCFTYAWQDVSFRRASGDRADGRYYTNACSVYTRFLMAGMLLILPVCYWVYALMIGKAYAQSLATIPLFLLVGVISAVSSFIGNIFYAIKDTGTIFWSTVLSAAVNVALVMPCIRLFGINGANISAVAGFIVNIAVRSLLLRKIEFRFQWLPFALLLAYSAAAFGWFIRLTWAASFGMLLLHLLLALVLFRRELRKIFGGREK